MHTTTLISLCISAGTAMAQTAAGVWPQTKTNLGVSFGDNIITPGAWIEPNDTTYPTVYPGYSTSSYPGTYMLMMVDYDVADSAFATLDQYSSLVPGRLVNTTTRLHWWGWNYTLQDGKFINTSNALASYHPAQPATSRVHDFTLFLFDQPQDYAPPQDVLDGLLEEHDPRHNFTLAPIVEAVGNPLAATYFWSSTPGVPDNSSATYTYSWEKI
ncbi:hypothetical protein BO83DRAFT_344049 [Aspergillus eucalypticola CBS 122712]|uniref:PEBP-like protein n=1 Tax=Aspergillus eucalypticola (strain CBS 122712 / IBT 29274) TaxID=1448314 RepID=A0A317UX83_ASPEC|nr:uncharacterized protein BO83DRAFT_344049 [Aspergillus eucalypticola CBS 122712]PWY66644.1 hypothetical protein BO83DRAFT_344049 [Aspergillus eucalypticola CBS 122712]